MGLSTASTTSSCRRPPSEDELLQPSSLRPEQLQPFASNSCQLGAAGGAGSGDGSTRFDMMGIWGML